MKDFLHYYTSSIIVTVFGLVAAYNLGIDGWTTLWIASILAVLEVSLSFDNAVVNARVLKTMDEIWRKRFITWGMAIAVFGMRMVFPVIIVSIALGINPYSAFMLAVSDPDQYAHALESVHTAVMGFGGTFLMMVALKFFIDFDKEVHWFDEIEDRLTKLGKIEAVHCAITLLLVYGVYTVIRLMHNEADATSFLVSSLLGMVTFIFVDGLEAFIGVDAGDVTGAVVKSGLAAFLYLEVLDASFSFDGVLGALALTNNIFIIMIGLGIGAMFVRSLTLQMVDKGTVDAFIYLEHGAFYAIFGLAAIMFINTVYEIPESITGLIGAAFIGASLVSSIKFNKTRIAE
jgi:hypothetical protein